MEEDLCEALSRCSEHSVDYLVREYSARGPNIIYAAERVFNFAIKVSDEVHGEKKDWDRLKWKQGFLFLWRLLADLGKYHASEADAAVSSVVDVLIECCSRDCTLWNERAALATEALLATSQGLTEIQGDRLHALGKAMCDLLEDKLARVRQAAVSVLATMEPMLSDTKAGAISEALDIVASSEGTATVLAALAKHEGDTTEGIGRLTLLACHGSCTVRVAAYARLAALQAHGLSSVLPSDRHALLSSVLYEKDPQAREGAHSVLVHWVACRTLLSLEQEPGAGGLGFNVLHAADAAAAKPVEGEMLRGLSRVTEILRCLGIAECVDAAATGDAFLSRCFGTTDGLIEPYALADVMHAAGLQVTAGALYSVEEAIVYRALAKAFISTCERARQDAQAAHAGTAPVQVAMDASNAAQSILEALFPDDSSEMVAVIEAHATSGSPAHCGAAGLLLDVFCRLDGYVYSLADPETREVAAGLFGRLIVLTVSPRWPEATSVWYPVTNGGCGVWEDILHRFAHSIYGSGPEVLRILLSSHGICAACGGVEDPEAPASAPLHQALAQLAITEKAECQLDRGPGAPLLLHPSAAMLVASALRVSWTAHVARDPKLSGDLGSVLGRTLAAFPIASGYKTHIASALTLLLGQFARHALSHKLEHKSELWHHSAGHVLHQLRGVLTARPAAPYGAQLFAVQLLGHFALHVATPAQIDALCGDAAGSLPSALAASKTRTPAECRDSAALEQMSLCDLLRWLHRHAADCAAGLLDMGTGPGRRERGAAFLLAMCRMEMELALRHVQRAAIGAPFLPPGELQRFLVVLLALPFQQRIWSEANPSREPCPESALEARDLVQTNLVPFARLGLDAKAAIAAAAVPAFRKTVSSGNASAAPALLLFVGKLLCEELVSCEAKLAGENADEQDECENSRKQATAPSDVHPVSPQPEDTSRAGPWVYHLHLCLLAEFAQVWQDPACVPKPCAKALLTLATSLPLDGLASAQISRLLQHAKSGTVTDAVAGDRVMDAAHAAMIVKLETAAAASTDSSGDSESDTVAELQEELCALLNMVDGLDKAPGPDVERSAPMSPLGCLQHNGSKKISKARREAADGRTSRASERSAASNEEQTPRAQLVDITNARRTQRRAGHSSGKVPSRRQPRRGAQPTQSLRELEISDSD